MPRAGRANARISRKRNASGLVAAAVAVVASGVLFVAYQQRPREPEPEAEPEIRDVVNQPQDAAAAAPSAVKRKLPVERRAVAEAETPHALLTLSVDMLDGGGADPKKREPEPDAEAKPEIEEAPAVEEVEPPKTPPVAPLLAAPAADTTALDRLSAFEPVPYVPPGKNWQRFLIMIWQFKTNVMEDLPLYKEAGFHGHHIDRGEHEAKRVEFAKRHDLPYYVDHTADKGYLHLTDRTGKDSVLRKKHVVARPQSLVAPSTIETMKGHIRRNIAVTKEGPVAAYAFDDEVSLGSFNSPSEVDGSPRSVAGYRRWLERSYETIGALNASWSTQLTSFEEANPCSFEEVRHGNNAAPFAAWRLARWMDWRSYMDSQFAACLADLTRYANSLDPRTPAGIVGGQQPAPYGGFDYTKVCQSMQWIEAYDIGGSCEIVRSLWGAGPERRPYVQTWFSTGEARRDSWFLWYYLLHGCRGVIAWPDKDGSWFHYEGGGLAPFTKQNADAIREVQSDVSKAILDLDVEFDADPVAVYYSHPSVQATWAMDSVTHGGSWPNRSSSLDNTCQTAGKNRVAWFKLIEDCGLQYNVVTPRLLTDGELQKKGYKVLVLGRIAAMSDEEAVAVRQFVESGGTVIADHLTAVLTERGNGRAGGGALDDLLGIARDETKGYLDGRHITEIDGELYQKPYLERLKYDGALRHDGIVVYERGTTASNGKATARVGSADVVVRSRAGAGRTVYLNLTPIAYYDLSERLGAFGAEWRKLVTALFAEAGVKPRARVLAGGKPVPLAEFLYWRKGTRSVVGLIKNPTKQGSITGIGEVHGVTGETVDVQIVFQKRRSNIVNLRTGRRLMNGTTIRAKWNPSEALLFEMDR